MKLPQALALARIERRGRLVEHQHRRVREQAERDVDALAVAAREAVHPLVGALPQAGLLEHRPHRAARIRDALQAREELEVLAHREPRVDRGLLGNPADPRACTAPLAPDAHGARARRLDAREDREQRRLARAVGADHRDELARVRLEVDAAQGLALAVALGDAPHREQRPLPGHAHASTPIRHLSGRPAQAALTASRPGSDPRARASGGGSR